MSKSGPITNLPTLVKSGNAKGFMQQRGNLTDGAQAPVVKHIDGVAVLVDPMLASSASYCVLVHEGTPLDAMLNQVDTACNANKYYKISSLSRDGAFFLWTRWGRIGEAQRFQNALKGPMDKNEAISLFHKTFASKAGVSWSNRVGAVPGRKGKYSIVKQQVVEVEKSSEALPPKSQPKSMGTPEGVLAYVLDNDARKAELDSLGIDVASGLLRLAPEQLAAAYDVLSQISELLGDVEGAEGDYDMLRSLSDSFYTLVPTKGGRHVLPLIDSHELLCSKLEQLEALASGTNGKKDVVSTDAFAKSCGLELSLVKGHEQEALAAYVSGSTVHGYNLSLEHAFEVSHPKVFSKGDPSKRSVLCFHGSRRVNLESILHSGGLKLKNNAVKIGQMFDHGIYGALNSSKSFNYNFGSQILLGVEFESAKPIEPTSAQPDAKQMCSEGGFDSVHARGKRSTVVEWQPLGSTGLMYPKAFGEGPDHSELLYDELVVHTERQARLRYIFVVKKTEDEATAKKRSAVPEEMISPPTKKAKKVMEATTTTTKTISVSGNKSITQTVSSHSSV